MLTNVAAPRNRGLGNSAEGRTIRDHPPHHPAPGSKSLTCAGASARKDPSSATIAYVAGRAQIAACLAWHPSHGSCDRVIDMFCLAHVHCMQRLWPDRAWTAQYCVNEGTLPARPGYPPWAWAQSSELKCPCRQLLLGSTPMSHETMHALDDGAEGPAEPGRRTWPAAHGDIQAPAWQPRPSFRPDPECSPRSTLDPRAGPCLPHITSSSARCR